MRMRDVKNSDSYEWIAKHFDTTKVKLEEALQDEKATSFLLIWPIMESEVFEGFFRNDSPQKAAKLFAPYSSELNIESAFIHFHTRYQDKTNYKHLKHKDQHTEVYDAILHTSVAEVSEEDRIQFILYVIFRFRNNIFHGNKGIRSWNKYTAEISYCLVVMMQIIDCAKKNNLSIGK